MTSYLNHLNFVPNNNISEYLARLPKGKENIKAPTIHYKYTIIKDGCKGSYIINNPISTTSEI